MRAHRDHRRTFYALTDFPTPGDVNVVLLLPNVPIAWHRHQHQADYLFVIHGVVRIGLIDPVGGKSSRLHGAGTEVVIVPPNWWHGYAAVDDEATLVSYITQHYDPTDEERHAIGEGLWSW